ncbi:putative phospholipid-transporting ATPase [Thelohanellus kitauei]|uniref:Phospholipid-transporting ATPase n=1 Tax=Thelohanellus kitauei TaxID=669202 RepID=A0A0C2M2M7_THEKT|nr:putative phospholipid-transporting ATPase [Thelohanellus kitauei]
MLDMPNNELNKFNALAKIESEKYMSRNVILRGCQIKNTKWVVGVVVYSGHETKLMMIKRSTIDKKVDHLVIILFIILIILALISTTLSIITRKKTFPNHWYLKSVQAPASFFAIFVTFFILYHKIVPVSLISTIEIVKLIQAYFVTQDLNSLSKKSSNNSAVKTCTIIEDLGHVNYIFADKTGTLTRNEMILKTISVGQGNFNMDENFPTLINEGTFNKDDETTKLFMTNLMICNSVIVENEEKSGTRIFKSSSPDEVAIVSVIDKYGFKFIQRTSEGVHIEYLGNQEFWQILETCHFSSERKKMSVIAKSPDGRYYLFTKGAESHIFDRLEMMDEISEKTNRMLEEFANMGLRTLCIAYREIQCDPSISPPPMMTGSSISFTSSDIMSGERDSDVEQDFKVLGCTGIEDRLQDNISETIFILREAGLRIWMLTGDKLETGINVAFSSKILENSMKLYLFCCESKEECLTKINKIMFEQKIQKNTNKMIENPSRFKNMAFILVDDDLKYILEDEVSTDFLTVAVYCKAVIFCRVSASQKRDVAMLVKNGVSDVVTLAIGDGGNDCMMIRASDIGVGIVGEEGLSSTNAADFAIEEFQVLSHLLMVHGYASYRKIGNCAYFVFYQNVLMNVMSFFYGFISLFSGKSIIHKIHHMLLAKIYVLLPPFCFGILDVFTSKEAAVNVPYLYRSIRKNYFFGVKRFIFWFLNALLHCFLIFLLCYVSLMNGTFDAKGMTVFEPIFETIIVSLIVFVICLKSVLELRNWNILTQSSIWIGYIAFILSVAIFSRCPTRGFETQMELLDVDILLVVSPQFYSSFFIPFIVLFPDFIFRAYFHHYIKDSKHVLYAVRSIDCPF